MRFANLLRFLQGPAVFLAPGWIVLGLGLLRRDFLLMPAAGANSATVRFLRWTFLGSAGFVVAMILGFGLFYVPRFDAPLFVLLVLAAAPLIDIDRARWPVVEWRVLWTAAIVAAVTFISAVVAYTFFTGHDNMQEPLATAAAIIRADWDRQYACGPAYYLGDRRSAHGMSITGDREPVGIPMADLRLVHWFDPERLRDRGAALVYRGAFPQNEVTTALPGIAHTEPKTFNLPLLRTLNGVLLTYSYAFIPPAACPPG